MLNSDSTFDFVMGETKNRDDADKMQMRNLCSVRWSKQYKFIVVVAIHCSVIWYPEIRFNLHLWALICENDLSFIGERMVFHSAEIFSSVLINSFEYYDNLRTFDCLMNEHK